MTNDETIVSETLKENVYAEDVLTNPDPYVNMSFDALDLREIATLLHLRANEILKVSEEDKKLGYGREARIKKTVAERCEKASKVLLEVN